VHFLVIFVVNLVNFLLYFVSLLRAVFPFPELTRTWSIKLVFGDVGAVGGVALSQMITATMISRLVLNLRAAGSSGRETYDGPSSAITFTTRIVGNLGEELETIFDDYEPRRRTIEDISLEDYPRSHNRSNVHI